MIKPKEYDYYGDDMTANRNATRGYVNTTLVDLKEYFLALLKERKLYTDTRLDNIEKGIITAKEDSIIRIDAADESNERRLSILNEFRKTVEDWIKNSATKEQLEGLKREIGLEIDKVCLLVEQQRKEINELKEFRAVVDAKASRTAVLIFGAIAVLGFIMAVIDWITAR